MSQMTPKEIVHELDKHIIGQDEAKKYVAIALRNRWRRMQLEDDLKPEVTPKNILMIGPTGVGKTEIARRLAKLANAPFVKVEATKFTEVGYVGRDVEQIIRELVETSMKDTRERAKEKVQQRANDKALERVLNILVPPARSSDNHKKSDKSSKPIGFANEPLSKLSNILEATLSQSLQNKSDAKQSDSSSDLSSNSKNSEQTEENSAARKMMREKLKSGELDDKEIELDVPVTISSMEIMGPPGMEDVTSQISDMMQTLKSGKKKKRTVKIKQALKILKEEEASKLVDDEDIKQKAIENAEQNGIVFVDEIDKVCKRSDHGGGGEVSREGVQRDLLPLVEGSTVSTKYGMIKTDYILFIASGAFHLSKPSDLIPELQGRLPIRVELKALKVEDFKRILTEPHASLTKQYKALMKTEGLNIEFTDTAVDRLAEIAWQVNEQVENIGARRLHTLMERLLEEASFEAPDLSGTSLKIDKAYVDKSLSGLAKDEDLSRYIL